MADRTVLYKIDITGNAVPKSKEFATNLKLVKKETDEADKKVSAFRKVLAGLAGDMGSTGARAVNLAQGLGGAGLAGAATAAAAAVGMFAVALVRNVHQFAEYNKTAAEAEKRIRGLGLVTEEQAGKVRDLGVAYKQSEQSLDAFKVKLAALDSDGLRQTLDTSLKIKTAWEGIWFVIKGGLAAMVENRSLLGLLPGGGSSQLVTGPIKMTSGVKGSSDVSSRDLFPVRTEQRIGGGSASSASPYDPSAFVSTLSGLNVVVSTTIPTIRDFGKKLHRAGVASEMAAASSPLRTSGSVGGGGIDMLGVAGAAMGGSMSGVVGALAGGPIGMAAVAVMDFLPKMGETIRNLGTQLKDFVTGLPDFIRGALSAVTDVIDMVPAIVTGIATAAPMIVTEIVAALPDILIGLASLLVEIPKAIIKAMLDMPRQIWMSIRDGLKELLDALNPFKTFKKNGAVGNLLDTLNPFNDRKDKVPKLASGGDITSDGLAYVHAGERVEPAGVTNNNSRGGDIHVHGSIIDTAGLFDILRKNQGSNGRRMSLSALPV